MNVFIIPSWYPSKDHPHTGIFNKEQAEALAHLYPDANFALSTWGTHEDDLLLWARDHVMNMGKIMRYFAKRKSIRQLQKNLTEYYSPAFSWSRKILKGNIRQIIRVNEHHLKDFEQKVGKADVIHAHSAYPAGWVAMELSRKYHIPYLITEQMSPFPFEDFLERNNTLSPYLQEPFRHAACNIAVSPQQEATLRQWGIANLRCIPNLTRDDFFKPSGKSSAPNKAFTFFTLGRLEPQKGIPYLLKAIALLKESRQDFIFKIGGEGYEGEDYRRLANELQINDKIEWLGYLDREKALRQYQQCDAFVLPSLHENLPLVLLEAIACGKPVISTRCGGPESIITPLNGLLIEAADQLALYEALKYMINNKEKYPQEQIRKDFCARYSRAVVCKQLMEVYQQLSTSHK